MAAPVLQPADIFLDMSGEDIRRRMYVFSDPGGNELCLRPELTIPVCRLYLESEGGPQRLCSLGSVYRYQKRGSAKLREFTQVGVECLGTDDAEAADAEAITLAARALAEAGLKGYEIEMGDLALFDALVDALGLPPGWQARLKRHFWRPDYFREPLGELAAGGVKDETGDRAADLGDCGPRRAGRPRGDRGCAETRSASRRSAAARSARLPNACSNRQSWRQAACPARQRN